MRGTLLHLQETVTQGKISGPGDRSRDGCKAVCVFTPPGNDLTDILCWLTFLFFLFFHHSYFSLFFHADANALADKSTARREAKAPASEHSITASQSAKKGTQSPKNVSKEVDLEVNYFQLEKYLYILFYSWLIARLIDWSCDWLVDWLVVGPLAAFLSSAPTIPTFYPAVFVWKCFPRKKLLPRHGKKRTVCALDERPVDIHRVSNTGDYRSTAFSEVNAHQKQWFFKGREYTKPMGFDGWFF